MSESSCSKKLIESVGGTPVVCVCVVHGVYKCVVEDVCGCGCRGDEWEYVCCVCTCYKLVCVHAHACVIHGICEGVSCACQSYHHQL